MFYLVTHCHFTFLKLLNHEFLYFLIVFIIAALKSLFSKFTL